MKLLTRDARPADLDRCLELVRDRFVYDDFELKSLRTIWHDLIVDDVGGSVVVFASQDPQRILAFGMSAAVDRKVIEAASGNGKPFVTKMLVAEWSSGRNPFYTEPLLASANAGAGANLLILNHGISDATGSELSIGIYMALSEAFIGYYEGLNVASFAQECFFVGWYRDFVSESGLNIRTYDGHDHVLSKVPIERRPFVLWKTRDEVLRQPGHLIAPLFLRFDVPRFGFDALERRMLRLALEGEPDGAIAENLVISMATLKKRWLHIYELMESCIPQSSNNDGRRGTESRRHALRYVRQHSEELFPFPKRASNSKRQNIRKEPNRA